jgi:hypothetical protein
MESRRSRLEDKSSGKWFVVSGENDEIQGTRGASKEEATSALSLQLNMLHGVNNDWSYWKKRGYKVRRSNESDGAEA